MEDENISAIRAGRKKNIPVVLTREEVIRLLALMNTLHRGRAVGGAADIIVFYAGAEGVPTTVLPNTDNAAKWPCA